MIPRLPGIRLRLPRTGSSSSGPSVMGRSIGNLSWSELSCQGATAVIAVKACEDMKIRSFDIRMYYVMPKIVRREPY